MQALVRGADEPITAFIDRVRSLHADAGASTVLVIGGSGDYLDVADRVVGMARYRPADLTAAAREVAAAHPTGRLTRAGSESWPSRHRFPDPRSISARRGRRERFIKVRSLAAVDFGRERIELAGVRQIVSRAQAPGGGAGDRPCTHLHGRRGGHGGRSGGARRGAPPPRTGRPRSRANGDLASPRVQDVAAALSRLRSLRLRSGPRT